MTNLRFGITIPNYGKAISARGLAELANEAEAAGWSGFFIWDHILAGKRLKVPMVDPRVAVAAMAMTTSHIPLRKRIALGPPAQL